MSRLVRYERPGTTLSDIVNSVLGSNSFSWQDRDISSTNWPKIDIVENADSYLFRADIPGVDKEDVHISVEEGVLTISGEKKQEVKEQKQEGYRYYERSYGSFSRSFKLPRYVDTEHINAELKNGVLSLEIKKSEAAKPKKIDISVG